MKKGNLGALIALAALSAQSMQKPSGYRGLYTPKDEELRPRKCKMCSNTCTGKYLCCSPECFKAWGKV